MKKLFFATLLVVFAFSNLNAQTFGVTAGYDATSFGGDGDGSESGFYAGAFGEFELSDTFDVRTEVLYSAVEDFNQIKVPIMAKYEFAENFSGLFGPTLDINLEDNDAMKSFSFGITGGLSYDFSEELFAEARYAAGLSNLSDVDGVDLKSNAFMIGVGYRFN